MLKLVEYKAEDDFGVQIELIEPGGPMVKTAEASDELQEAIALIKPNAAKLYILVNAMGAGEYYGSNRNGDYFPEKVLQQYHKTFETLARVYKHHVNKDPMRSYGRPVFSHYNNKMHRVELILEIDKGKDAKIEQQVREGTIKVSMGAKVPFDICLDVNTLVNTTILKNIEPGDFVFTHEGRSKEVVATSTRIVDSYIEVLPFGDYLSLNSTEEHPFQIANYKQFKEGKITRLKALKTDYPILDWKEAKDLNIGDYLVFRKTAKHVSTLGINFARILGYYLAEGWLIKQRSGKKKDGPMKTMGVSFSFNINEHDYIDELADLLSEYGTPKIYNAPEKHECRISVYSKDLVDKLLKYGGEYPGTKFINSELYKESEDFILELLGTLINGDGSQDHSSQQGVIRYSTISEYLGRGIRRLCLEAGITASINRRETKTTYGDSTVYTVYIPASASKILSSYSVKVKSYDKGTSSRLFNFDNHVLIPIKKICNHDDYLEVKNIQVEDDESYQAQDYVSHNCSICGHKARRMVDYCEHLKRPNINRLRPDGRRAYAINTQPKFFDISVVTIPADRTAFMMRKLAEFEGNSEFVKLSSEMYHEVLKKADVKEAEIEKQIDGETMSTADTDPKGLIYNTQDELPKADLINLVDKHGAEAILRALAEMNIMPKPVDFQRIMLRSGHMDDLMDHMDSHRRVFPIFSDTEPLPFKCNHSELPDELLHEMSTYVPRRSLSKPLIIVRVMRKFAENKNIMSDDPYTQYSKNELAQMENGSHVKTPIYKNPAIPLTALGGMYLGYSRYFKKAGSRSAVANKFIKKPWMYPLLAFGIGAGTVGAQKVKEFSLSNISQMQKQAGAASNIAAGMLVSLPATYYTSYNVGAKKRYGIPVGNIENTVAKHPFITGLASSVAAGAAIKRLTKVASAEYFSTMSNKVIDELYEKLVLST